MPKKNTKPQAYEVVQTTWLIVVALPLWRTGELAGSSVEYTTYVFLGVIAPILFMPYKYFVYTYILGKKLE